jgi:hypothetical protein
MKIKLFLPLGGFLLSACAATTPPPRFSALDPADPKASESRVDPRPLLPEGPAEPSIEPPPTSPAASATADVYSCPAHPRVREAGPGQCRLCGRTLEKQPAQPHGDHQP